MSINASAPSSGGDVSPKGYHYHGEAVKFSDGVYSQRVRRPSNVASRQVKYAIDQRVCRLR